MKNIRRARILILAALPALVCARAAAQEPAEPLRLVQTIALDDVKGRIDHLAADLEGKRLFMAALGNNTLEVFDAAAGKRIATIKNLSEPQGVGYLPDSGTIVAANGADGTVRFYDGKSFELKKTVAVGEDPDNIRLDRTRGLVWVGYGGGALAALDPATGEKKREIKLPGHPESFRLEPAGMRIFVNVPAARCVKVVNRTDGSTLATWPFEKVRANFPLFLDEEGHRVFIGCRQPARLVVCDPDSGKEIAAVECAGDTDDLFYDAKRKRVYLTGGEGKLDVFDAAGPIRRLAQLTTAPGARTSFFVPEWDRLFVAVPARGAQKAELRVYEPR